MTGGDRRARRRNHGVLLVLGVLVLAALGLGPSVASGAAQASGGGNVTAISACTTIDEPGTYVLTRDLEAGETNPCVRIVGTDSVVVDGDGHTIGSARVGVGVRGSTNVVLRHLEVRRAGLTGILVWGSERVEIRGNAVVNATGEDHGFQNNSIHVWESTEVEIENNTIVDAANDGVYAGRASRVTIRSNTIENVSDRGVIVLESTNVTVDGNDVANPDTDGWGVEVHDVVDVTVADNVVTNTWYGIEAKNNSTDVVIRGNEITNTTRCSIAAEPSEDGSVRNVVIEDNVVERHAGIEVWTNAADVVVRNNVVRSSSSQGIRVKGIAGPVDIYGNTIVDSSSAAVRVADTHGNLRIYENDVRRHATGIYLLNSSDVLIERNRFTDVARAFEERDATGIEYRNNTVDETGGPGQPGFGIVAALIALFVVGSGRRYVGR